MKSEAVTGESGIAGIITTEGGVVLTDCMTPRQRMPIAGLCGAIIF